MSQNDFNSEISSAFYFLAVAKALDCKICVRTDKKRVLDCLEWEEINNRLTTEWEEAKIHVLPMNSLTIKVCFGFTLG